MAQRNGSEKNRRKETRDPSFAGRGDNGVANYVYNSAKKVWDDSDHSRKVLERISMGDVKILEVGCGTGHFAEILRSRGASVVAIDNSPESIVFSKASYPNVKFVRHSAYDDFNVLGGPFDCIVSIEVLEHLVRPDLFLQNIFSNLKPGGQLLLTTPYHGYVKNLAISLLNGWDNHFGVDWVGGHIKFFSPRTLRTMLAKSGFESARFSGIGRIPYLSRSMLVECHKKK